MFETILPKNIFQLFFPIFTIWKYIGLPFLMLEIDPKTKNTKFIVKKTFTIYFFILIITMNGIFCTIIYRGMKKFEDYTNFSKLLISFINHIGILFFCRKHANEYAQIVTECALVENILFKMTDQKLNTKKIAKKLLGMLVPQVVIMVVDLFKDINQFGFDLLLLVFTGELFYSLFVVTLLLHFLLIMKQLCRQLDKHLNTVLKNCDFMQCIKTYHVLCNISTKINKSFDEFILLKGLADFIFLTVNVFYFCTPQYTPHEKNIFSYLFNLLYKWISIPLILIFDFVILRFYEDLLQIVNKKNEKLNFLFIYYF